MKKLIGKPHYRLSLLYPHLWVLTDARWFPQFPVTLEAKHEQHDH